VARVVLASAAYTTAIVAGLLLLLACVDITYRVVVPCTSDSAKAPADTMIRCSTLDSLARR
jgi:hypothetical protein